MPQLLHEGRDIHRASEGLKLGVKDEGVSTPRGVAVSASGHSHSLAGRRPVQESLHSWGPCWPGGLCYMLTAEPGLRGAHTPPGPHPGILYFHL